MPCCAVIFRKRRLDNINNVEIGREICRFLIAYPKSLPLGKGIMKGNPPEKHNKTQSAKLTVEAGEARSILPFFARFFANFGILHNGGKKIPYKKTKIITLKTP